MEAQRELRDARIANGGVVSAKRPGTKRRVGYRKVWMIEDVEKVSAELDAVSLSKGKVLGNEEIPVLLEWSANLRNVTPQVAEGSVASRRYRQRGSTDWERTAPGSTKRIQPRKSCSRLIASRRRQDRGIEDAGRSEVLR